MCTIFIIIKFITIGLPTNPKLLLYVYLLIIENLWRLNGIQSCYLNKFVTICFLRQILILIFFKKIHQLKKKSKKKVSKIWLKKTLA